MGALKMNVHDSMVVRYSADLENETFAMYLKPDTEEGVKEVNFEGVLAHWFEYVASWNVLYDIEELDVKTFRSYFKKVLLEGKSDGWPLFFETLEDLEEQLVNKGYKTYYISGCCGITGFVIAEQVSVKV